MRFAMLLLLAAVPAAAAEVFVNNVNVDGLTNQQFEKVNVRIDDKGNVYIEAPGYAVKRVSVGPVAEAAKEEGIITKKYFLVTENNPVGATEYDIDLFINGKFIRGMHSSDDQIVAEITKHLRPGKNQIQLQAKKVIANKEQPKSFSKSHVFRVIVGEGKVTEDQVVIEKPLITFTRTAADQDDVAQEFSLTTR